MKKIDPGPAYAIGVEISRTLARIALTNDIRHGQFTRRSKGKDCRFVVEAKVGVDMGSSCSQQECAKPKPRGEILG